MVKITGERSSNIEDRRPFTLGGILDMLNYGLYGDEGMRAKGQLNTDPTVVFRGDAFARPRAETYEAIDRVIKQRYDMRMQQYIRSTVPDRVEVWGQLDENGKLVWTEREVWPSRDEPLEGSGWFNLSQAPAQQQVMRVAEVSGAKTYATKTYTTTKSVTRAAPNAQQLETLTYTLLGEAVGGGVMGMTAVANVIRNRADSGIYSADPVEVATQAKQFSAWNAPSEGGNVDTMKKLYPVGSKQYEMAKTLAKNIIYAETRAPDPTGSALMYHKVGATAYWSTASTTSFGTKNIGGNTFYAREPDAPVVQASITALSYNGGAGIVNANTQFNLLDKLVKGQPTSYVTDLNDTITERLAAMYQSAPPKVRQDLMVLSGARSLEKQANLFEAAVLKYGSKSAARKWVAPPGGSQHNFGNAVDFTYLSAEARDWVHANAKDYGLYFRMANEPWHVEPIENWDGVLPATNGIGVVATSAGAPVPLLPPLKMLMANLPRIPFGGSDAAERLATSIDSMGGLNRLNGMVMEQRAALARQTMRFPDVILGETTEVAMSVTPVLEWPDSLTDTRPSVDVTFDVSRGAFVEKATDAAGILAPGTDVGLDALDMAMAAARQYTPVTISGNWVRPEVPGALPAAKPKPVAETGGLSPTERAEQRAAMLTFPVRPEGPISDNTSNAPPFPKPRPASITTPPGPPAATENMGGWADVLTDEQKQAIREIGGKTIVGGMVREKVGQMGSVAIGSAADQVLEIITGIPRLTGSGQMPTESTVPSLTRSLPGTGRSGAARVDDIVTKYQGGGAAAVPAPRPKPISGTPVATTPTGVPVTRQVRDAIASTTVPSYTPPRTTTPTGSTLTVAQRNAISSTSGIKTTTPAKTPVSKTTYVHKDGTTSTTTPGQATIPTTYKPVITWETKTITVPGKPVKAPTQAKPGGARPEGPAAGMPAAPKPLSAPGAGLTAAQRNAMSDLTGTGLGVKDQPKPKPVPPVPVVTIPPKPVTKTIKVKKVVMVAVPGTPQAATTTVRTYEPSTNQVVQRQVIRGSSTGREYDVGSVYTTGTYRYEAQADGTFKNVGKADPSRSSAENYAAAASRSVDRGTGGAGGNPTWW